MALVRDIFSFAAVNQLVMFVQHMFGVNNDIADSLSRLQVDRFRRWALAADAAPTPDNQPSGLVEGLEAEADRLWSTSIAKGTWRTDNAGLAVYRRFCQLHGWQETPATNRSLQPFVARLSRTGRTAQTAQVYSPVSCSFQDRIFELLSPHVAHSTKRLVEAVWKKIDRAFTVHSTDSASQLMGSTVHLHGLLACVPHRRDAEAESSFEH